MSVDVFTAYPAIDVRDGRVVRLVQGDYDRETRYAADPFALAMHYADAGARWLHLVDLDAARAGGYARAAAAPHR
jgi:phosphoribosylformimino-5-aminoimidazole carboxamide ribotide isomerase